MALKSPGPKQRIRDKALPLRHDGSSGLEMICVRHHSVLGVQVSLGIRRGLDTDDLPVSVADQIVHRRASVPMDNCPYCGIERSCLEDGAASQLERRRHRAATVNGCEQAVANQSD